MRWQYRWIVNLLLAVVLAATNVLQLLPPSAFAHPDEATDVANIKSRLGQFFDFMDTLGGFDELGQDLPLTLTDPSSGAALNLSEIFSGAGTDIKDTVTGLVAADLAALGTALDGADFAFGGVSVAFNSVTIGSHGDVIDIDFTLTLTRENVNIPVSFNGSAFAGATDDFISLNGSGFTLDFVLTVPLSFKFDATQADPLLALYLDTAPIITLAIDNDGPQAIVQFSALLGFLDVTVDASATLNIAFSAIFQDPDGDGKITLDELFSTALADIFSSFAFGNATGNDVDVTFKFNSAVITGGPDDATLSIVDDNLADGFGTVITPVLGELANFANITPNQVLGGLALLLGSLTGAQGTSAPSLPFIQGTLNDIGDAAGKVFDVAKPILNFLQSQTAANIVCGTQPTNPPGGPSSNLPAGSTLYCQALAPEGPVSGTVVWSIIGGTAGANTSGVAANGTLGTTPTVRATFTSVSGTPDISVTWTGGACGAPPSFTCGHANTVDPALSVDELVDLLNDFVGLPDGVAYDSAHDALTYHITKTILNADTPARTGSIDFGDQLRNWTNLSGLNASGGASATVNVGDISLDVTFGVILVPNANTIGAALDETQTHNGGGDSADLVDTDANFNATPGLLGDTIRNVTKDKTCTVTEVVSATTLKCAISGGDWDNGNVYERVRSVGDRFFMKVRTGATEHEFSISDATITATLILVGRIGFVEVELSGNDDANPIGTAFEVAKFDNTKPLFAVNITPTVGGITLQGIGTPISNAILLTDLLAEVTERVDADCNLKMSGGLKATAMLSGGAELGSGKVAIDWTDIFGPEVAGEPNSDCVPDVGSVGTVNDDGGSLDGVVETTLTVPDGTAFLTNQHIRIDDEVLYVTGIAGNDLTVTRAQNGTTVAAHTNGTHIFRFSIMADADLASQLQNFDPFPTVTGTHNGANGAVSLTDTTKNFPQDFPNILNLKLVNKTTSASCTILTFTGTDTVDCSLSGSTRFVDSTATLAEDLDAAETGVDVSNGAVFSVDQTIVIDEEHMKISAIAVNVLTVVRAKDGTTAASHTSGEAISIVDNTWKSGDEYTVEGNLFGFLAFILDSLDELVAALDALGVDVHAEIPLIGISTKGLVEKIQNIKVMVDELRGVPAGTIKCGPTDADPPSGNINTVADGGNIYCQLTTFQAAKSVLWKIITEAPATGTTVPADAADIAGVKGTHNGPAGQTTVLTDNDIDFSEIQVDGTNKLVGLTLTNTGDNPDSTCTVASVGVHTLTCVAPLTGGGMFDPGDEYKVGNGLATAGTTPSANAAFTVNDGSGTDNFTTPSEYQITVVWHDSAGKHTADFPVVTPPSSIQKLEELIEMKLGIPDEALEFELIDLGIPGGTHTAVASSTTVLTDDAADFLDDGVLDVHIVRNTTKGESCDIDSHTATTITCTGALSGGASWEQGDTYDIVNATGTDADADSNDENLEDDGADFVTKGILVGYTLVNTTDNKSCTIISRDADTLTCAPGSNMDFDVGDDYDVDGNNTKDFVIRIGYGVCTDEDNNQATNENIVIDQCDTNDVLVKKPPVDLSFDFAIGGGDLVGLQSDSALSIEYAARFSIDIGIPLALALPKIVILDTTGIELQAGAGSANLNLSASIGPITIQLGTAVTRILDEPLLDDTQKHTGAADAAVLTDADADFVTAEVPVGATLKNTSDGSGSECTIGAVAATTLTCGLEGGAEDDWDAGDAYEIGAQGTHDGDNLATLTDADGDFVNKGVATGMLLKNVTKDESCTITAVAATTLTCVLSGGADWDNGNAYQAGAIGTHTGSADAAVLTDAAINFTTKGIEKGDLLRNTTDGSSCKVGAFTATTVTCGLDGGTENDWDLNDVYIVEAEGLGIAKLGAEFSLRRKGLDDADNNQSFPFLKFVAGLAPPDVNFGGTTEHCANIDEDADGNWANKVNVEGHACAALSVAFNPYLGDLGFFAPDFANPAGWQTTDLQALLDKITGELLDWTLLLKMLPPLLEDLADSLDGAAQGVSIPFIGGALDAGADVVNALNDNVVTPLAGLALDIDAFITAALSCDSDADVDPFDIGCKIQELVHNLLTTVSPVNLLLDGPDSDTTAGELDDVQVTVLCDNAGDVCADGDLLTKIKDIRVTLLLGQGIAGPGAELPFDLGLQGLPLRLRGSIQPEVGWSVLVDFGLSRSDGPYLVTAGPGSTSDQNDVTDADADANADTDILEVTGADFPSDGFGIGDFLKNDTTGAECVVADVPAINQLQCKLEGGSAQTWTINDEFTLTGRHGRGASHPDFDPNDDAELKVSAGVGLGDLSGACTDTELTGVALLDGFSNNADGRCIEGILGFLSVVVRDGDTPGGVSTDDDRSILQIAVTLDISSDDDTATDGRLAFDNLFSVGLDLAFNAEANVDFRVRVGIATDGDTNPNFPSVLGLFHLSFDFDTSNAAKDTLDEAWGGIDFNNLYLDVGTFLGNLLGPTVNDVLNFLKPIRPFADFMLAEIPVISDVSKLAGGDPITVLSVLEVVSGNDLSMVKTILQVIVFVTSLPDCTTTCLIPLSDNPLTQGFSVSKTKAMGSPLSPDKAQELIASHTGAGSNLLGGVGNKTNAGPKPDPGTTADGRPRTFGVDGLSFPFLNNATEIFGILMGKDVTLVRYEFGRLRASAGFEYCLPPFIVVVVPVEICLGGSFEFEGRLALGYDTRGFRALAEGVDSAGDVLSGLIMGIFIDDFDAAGNEVPEFTFTATIYASGAASIYIFSIGVRAGLEATITLDWHDPNPDGKLYIEEIIENLSNPICLFDIAGKLDVFLEAFVEIDLFLFSVEFSIEIIRLTLLEFSYACTPPPPVPGTPGLTLDTIGGSVRINVGPFKGERNFAEDQDDEEVIVRQLGHYVGTDLVATPGSCGDKARISVTMFGFYDEYDVAALGIVFADLGAGKDQISFLPFQPTDADGNPLGDPIPFRVVVHVYGGDGNDKIKAGECGDLLRGGNNDDNIDGDAGNDDIEGNSGADQLNGGAGNDNAILGGDGDDTMNGGTGNDRLEGGPGNDTLNGGPGISSADTDNGDDTLVGDDGADTLTGGNGNDTLYGDEHLGDFTTTACEAAGDDTDADDDDTDALQGGNGNDKLAGGADNDRAVGNMGDDIVCGNSGNDNLFGDNEDAETGSDGNDDIFGGPGNDNLFGFGGRDQLFGDSGVGNDILLGGSGDDELQGGDGRDILRGEGGNDILVGDTGAIGGTHGAHAGGKDNGVVGDVTATNAAASGSVDDTYCANTDAAALPAAVAGQNADCLFGGDNDDYLFGEGGHDRMFGDNHADYEQGNAGNDFMRGGQLDDEMWGNAGTDEMFGDSGADLMYGGDDNDTMRGGIGDDTMEGNAATDTMNGDANQDDMIGGTSPATAADATNNDGDATGGDTASSKDTNDTMHGDADHDVMIGDNGTISRPGGEQPAGVKIRNVTVDVVCTDTTLSGPDIMNGNDGHDRLYGGDDADTIHGNAGDDYLEGNCGADNLFGDQNQDDVIGGTSKEANNNVLGAVSDVGETNMYGGGSDAQGTHTGGNNAATLTDAGGAFVTKGVAVGQLLLNRTDGSSCTITAVTATTLSCTLAGGTENDWDTGDAYQADLRDFDVMCGDNCSITRPVVSNAWVTDNFSAERNANGVVRRVVTLYDVATVALPAADVGFSGGDTMRGEGSFDQMWGQGGGDTMYGNNGDDHMEGNNGDDTMQGNAGQDDLIGGTGRTKSDDATTFVNARKDGVDTIHGGNNGADLPDDFDTIVGDNAIVDRANPWTVNTFNDAIVRTITFADVGSTLATNGVGTPGAGTSAGDHLFGEASDDTMYGQGGNDQMEGGTGDDYMEGNAGSDDMKGNDDDDDMVGGTALISFLTAANVVTLDPRTVGAGGGFSAAGTNGRHDAGETNMEGNAGFDFMTGDNGIITRRIVAGEWIQNTYNAGFQHFRVWLLDIDSADKAVVSGGDIMFGNEDDDVMYGQGNGPDADNDAVADGMIDEDPVGDVDIDGDPDEDGDGTDDEDPGADVMHGNDDHDDIEGNHGADWLFGDEGQDNVIGGTGCVNDDQLHGADCAGINGRQDGDDHLFGESDKTQGTENGSGADAMCGDNCIVTRPLTPLPDGDWTVETFNAQFNRQVKLLDVGTVTLAAIAGTSGDDVMYGNDNDDIMYGQGEEDTMFGNAGHDYMEGNAASDHMEGNDGEDDMIGGTGPTTSSSQLGPLEQSDKDTAIPGRTDESTAGRVVPLGTVASKFVSLGDTMHGNDGADNMCGDNCTIERPVDGGGQWKVFQYKLLIDSDGSVAPRHPTSALITDGHRIDRNTVMVETTPGKTAGSDLMFGDDGDDEMYGQYDDTNVTVPAVTTAGKGSESTVQCENTTDDDGDSTVNDGCSLITIGDEMYGGPGEDAMAGDQGNFTDSVLTATTTNIKPKEPFIDDDIKIQDTLFREFKLSQVVGLAKNGTNDTGGYDRMRGGDGGDWMHGGAGNDLMNGDEGNDHMFGDNQDDDMWGGRDHDHLWGGFGYDQMDLRPRLTPDETQLIGTPEFCTPSVPGDPIEWYTFGFEEGNPSCDGNLEEVDYMYGGWDADVMQSNVGDNGPRIGDRLIDWVGVYNLYILCPATYGEFVTTREFSPQMTQFIHDLARGDGAFQPGPSAPDPSGFNELAFVDKPDLKNNQKPPYLDTPAHFTNTVDCQTFP